MHIKTSNKLTLESLSTGEYKDMSQLFHDSQSPFSPTDTLNATLHLHDVTIHEVSYRMTRQVQELNSLEDTIQRYQREREREMNCMVEGEKKKKKVIQSIIAHQLTRTVLQMRKRNKQLPLWVNIAPWLLPQNTDHSACEQPFCASQVSPTPWKEAMFSLLSPSALFFIFCCLSFYISLFKRKYF